MGEICMKDFMRDCNNNEFNSLTQSGRLWSTLVTSNNSLIKFQVEFNYDLDEYFESKVFVFPMPGTPCSSDLAHSSMTELKNYLGK